MLKKTYIVIGVILLLLIVIRLALPSIVKRYVNKTLEELPGYTGHVEDIDLHLYRGAYTIDGLVLLEEKGNPKYPFLRVERTDLSVEWKSLFKGRVAAEVVMEKPRMNIVANQTEETVKGTSQDDWTKVVKDLVPIKINRFTVNNGRLHYLDFTSKPTVDLHISNMQLVAQNLANVTDDQNALPSPVRVTGSSIGGGQLKGDMRANLLKEIPDMNIDMQLTSVDLTSLNDFIKANGGFDVERGRLDMYSKVSVKDGQLDGYIKPFFEELKVLNWKKDKEEGGILQAAKEAVVGLFAEAAENQKRDQIATVIPVSGNLSAPDTDTWTTFVNVLRHAFIKAFNKGIDDKLSASAGGNKQDDKKDKKKDKEDKKDKKKDDKKDKKEE